MDHKNIIITGGAWHHEKFGGAYKVATEFSEYLSKLGHNVFYLAWSHEAVVNNPIIHNGVVVWRYSAPKAKSPSPFNVIGHIAGSRMLVKRICSEHRIDALNGHDFLQFIGALQGLRGIDAKRSFSVHSPLVMENLARWEIGGDEKVVARPTLRQRIAVRLLRLVERRVYCSAEVIQTDSRFTLGEISRDYGADVNGKGVVSSLWVDHERFLPVKDKEAVRSKLGGPWQCDIPLFFTLRRLVPRMGIANLVTAMSILRDKGDDCRLIIGGDGPERENLEALVKALKLTDRVFLVGRIPDETLPLCFGAPDCFVLPTRALECFGLIILEAYACGTPVIATPVGSIPEVMDIIGKPFLTRDVSPEALAEKLGQFMKGGLPFEEKALVEYSRLFSFENRAGKLAKALFQGERKEFSEGRP